MNILILTGKFGMGHYSAADAIKQEIDATYPDANIHIVDILEYLLPKASKVIYESFNILVTKWADLYNFFNNISGQQSITPLKNVFIKKIDRLFDLYSPDLIISTLPISSQYISKYKGLKGSEVPLCTFITDISSHNEWIAENTDYYFVGAKEIKNSLIEKGIKAEKIFVSGIPVKQQFKSRVISFNNKKTKEVLIMGGGLGLISFADELFENLNAMPYIKTTVITGNNKKMYEHIKNKYKNIKVVGYTDKVYEYMQRADLVLSKAGGITLFEAIYSEVPIYVTNPFLVQEVKNAHYIESKQIGRVIWDNKTDVTADIISLLNNDDAILTMKNNMKKIKNKIHQETIIDTVEKFKKGA